jgi:putative ABC transport system ATP-binding protein/macrolide transport system ATP-binding/permease protein/lipoprotein-releasing system ATP-binding protein
VILTGIASLIAIDQVAGTMQEREIGRRRALKMRLDKLSFDGLRTGIDEITFDDNLYSLQLRIQNAAREPFYVLLPVIEGFVQVGPAWEAFRVCPADGELREGTVVKLEKERTLQHLATIDGSGYAEPIAGYRHVKLTLEAFVSPEENPVEEIGERREEFFLFLRDVTRDAEFASVKTQRPSFIPLRAWTLLPKEAL